MSTQKRKSQSVQPPVSTSISDSERPWWNSPFTHLGSHCIASLLPTRPQRTASEHTMCRVTSLGGQGSGLLHAAYEGSAAWWGASSYKRLVRPRQVSSPLQPAGPKAHQALPPRNKIGGAQIHLPWLVLPPVHWVTSFLAPQETQHKS